ncbi:hypothetical protein ACH5RR_012138 [Cinchona calisaya]|uniref:Alcohol dehydrogenase-like C-terminal domain-containing protein n=1 Tax=Cinchona calisaya TaxID=153742 RepID=A0ABD3A9H1_9GENT
MGIVGLGHVAVKFAKAFGAKVIVISHSDRKMEEAKKFGADSFLVSSNQDAMQPLELSVCPLIMGRKQIGGSNIGGLKETQEMIHFAAKHNITAQVEVVPMDYVNKALERLQNGDVRYRFIIDVGNTLQAS